MNNFLWFLLAFHVLLGSHVFNDYFEIANKNHPFQIKSGNESGESEAKMTSKGSTDKTPQNEQKTKYGSCWYYAERIERNTWRGRLHIQGILRLNMEKFSSKEETESVLEKFFQTLQYDETTDKSNKNIVQSDSEDYTCLKFFKSKCLSQESMTNCNWKQTNCEKLKQAKPKKKFEYTGEFSSEKEAAKRNDDLVPKHRRNHIQQNAKESKMHSKNILLKKIELKHKNNYLLQLQNKEKSIYRWWILKKDENTAVNAMSKNPLTTFLVEKITNNSKLMIGDTIIPLNAKCAKHEKKKENATLAEVIAKNGQSIVLRFLHGEKNGQKQKIGRKEVCDEVLRVGYKFSEAEMSVYKRELESHVKKIPTMEASIEVELFNLCFKDPLDLFCAQSIHTWKLLQPKKHDYICSTLIWNAKLFHARNWLGKIESFHRTLKLKRKRTDSIELEQQSGYFLLYKILWLEIKAQSFNSAFAKLASEYAEKAYKTSDISNMKNHLGELRLLYKNGVGAKFDKDSKSQLHTFGLYKLTKNASKQLEKTYNEKKMFDFENGGTADNFSTILNFKQSQMKMIYSNVKKYMKALEKNKIMYSKVNVEKSCIGGQGVFPIENIQKYETIGIWSGELYGLNDENVFKNGGAKSDRNLYAIELNEGKSSFILDPDPKSYHSFPNDCRTARNFHNAIGTLTKSEVGRFNLGWLQFSYQGVPYMANVALKKIDAENSNNELFTYYGGNYVMNSLEKNKNDSKNRLEIFKNAGQNVIEILDKM